MTDCDVEQVAALPQPALGDQKVAGAGYRKEFRDALEDAEQQCSGDVGHWKPEEGNGESKHI
jgi:hypothetical protein